VLDGLRGDDSIAELRRREDISQSLYYSWAISQESGVSDPLLNKLQSSAFQPTET
jgi:transposase-like protein